MPDLGSAVECNNCGVAIPWGVNAKFHRMMPSGWTHLANTTAGDAYFDSDICRGTWMSTRNWQMPDVKSVAIARESGFVAPPPKNLKPMRARRRAGESKADAKARLAKRLVQIVVATYGDNGD